MIDTIFTAIALVCILEGILPFLSPGHYKHFISYLLQMDDKKVRIFGFIVMFVGVLSLTVVKNL